MRREVAASRCTNVLRKVSVSVRHLSVENSIILSCPISEAVNHLNKKKSLERKKNAFDPLCFILAP